MTRRLTPVTRAELVRRFRELGWEGPRQGTKHDFMIKGKHKVRIPNPHKNKDIGANILNAILSQADISRSEWLGR